MKIAIQMHQLGAGSELKPKTQVGDDGRESAAYFAEFEVKDAVPAEARRDSSESETVEVVEVMVVLRGRRDELEHPALGVTELVLNTVKAHSEPRRTHRDDVIDAAGVALAS